MNEFKQNLYRIIFEHDTKAGKAFDIVLIALVLLSVLMVMLETVEEHWINYKNLFIQFEFFFTGIFTVELLLRLYCSPKKMNYLFSFYGFIDVIAVLPTYLAFFLPGAQAFLIVRAMRLLRVFRILKLTHYTSAGTQLKSAMSASRPKIVVFLFFVATLVSIVGAIMFYIEGRENGFTSIPKSIYWAVVTMTTVGYGDIIPLTSFGQFVSTLLMIVGYGVIAVPTGIITTEMSRLDRSESCEICFSGEDKFLKEANFCHNCGRKLLPK